MTTWIAPGIPQPSCDLCGEPRPYDTWCGACDIDAQLAAYRAKLDETNRRATPGHEHARRVADQARLARGQWVRAGAMEVRLS